LAVAPSPHRASLSRILRIVVAVALTAYILHKAHPGDVLRITTGADWRWILAAIGLVFVDRTLMAYRWTVLLCALTPGSRPPFNTVLRIFFVSTFVGTFLPSVGGDLYRAYSLSRLSVSGVESAASVLMDRVLGVMAIVIVGVAALVPAPAAVRNTGMLVTLAAASIGCVVAAVAVFSERAASMAHRLTGRLANSRVRRIGVGMIDSVRRYSHHHRELVNVLGFSVGVQIIRIIQAWCLGRAIGIDAGLGMYFILIPVVLLIMLLPVTISGLGTSQGAFGWLFGSIGVPVAAAVALSILFVTLGVVGNLPGGLLYVFGPREARQTA
jgi:glycosyltransferase 2 family protein